MSGQAMDIPTTHIDWHCRACGFEHESDRPLYSYPVKCPECGAERITTGFKRRPANRVECDSTPTQYDRCGGDRQIQVYLFALTGEQASFCFDPDDVPDCDDAPEVVADEVLREVEAYFFSTSKENIRTVCAIMHACTEESDRNAGYNRMMELRKVMVAARHEYKYLAVDEAEREGE